MAGDFEPNCVLECANELGECPLWCSREKVLWWIDVAKPAVWRYTPSTGETKSWPLSKPPGAIALRKDGRLLVAFRRAFAVFDPNLGTSTPFEVSGLDLGEERFNDGKVDRSGRFWVGTMDRNLLAPVGQLYCMNGDGVIASHDNGFTLSNGIGWSPDNRKMYFAETHSGTIYEYEFDVGTGNITGRRAFTVVESGVGGPDGLCVDSQGNVWVAIFERGIVNQYNPQGTLTASVKLPVERPTSCALGGEDLKTLYITSACIGLSEIQKEAHSGAGGLWAVRVIEAGQAETYFAG